MPLIGEDGTDINPLATSNISVADDPFIEELSITARDTQGDIDETLPTVVAARVQDGGLLYGAVYRNDIDLPLRVDPGDLQAETLSLAGLVFPTEWEHNAPTGNNGRAFFDKENVHELSDFGAGAHFGEIYTTFSVFQTISDDTTERKMAVLADLDNGTFFDGSTGNGYILSFTGPSTVTLIRRLAGIESDLGTVEIDEDYRSQFVDIEFGLLDPGTPGGETSRVYVVVNGEHLVDDGANNPDLSAGVSFGLMQHESAPMVFRRPQHLSRTPVIRDAGPTINNKFTYEDINLAVDDFFVIDFDMEADNTSTGFLVRDRGNNVLAVNPTSVVASQNVVPASDGQQDLGLTGTRWGTLFVDDITTTSSGTFGTTLGVTGLITATAGITSGSNIVSDTDSTDDLGLTGTRWANLWVDTITCGINATVGGTLGVTGVATFTSDITAPDDGEIDCPGNLTFDMADPNDEVIIAQDAGTLPTLANATGLVIHNNSATGDNCQVSIISGTAADSIINFGDSGDENIGQIDYDNNVNNMLFRQATFLNLTLESGGTMVYHRHPSEAASNDCNINNGNDVHQVTSSIRFKEDLAPLEINPTLLHALDVKSFTWNELTESRGLRDFGLIAEETFEVIPQIVNVHDDGVCEGIRNLPLTMLMLAEIQNLNARILLLEAQA